MLSKEEFHALLKYKSYILSVNDIGYHFTYDKIVKEGAEIATYEVRVTDKGYFLVTEPFIYDTDDIILIPKNQNGYSFLLNPKTDEPHRRFIYLKEI